MGSVPTRPWRARCGTWPGGRSCGRPWPALERREGRPSPPWWWICGAPMRRRFWPSWSNCWRLGWGWGAWLLPRPLAATAAAPGRRMAPVPLEGPKPLRQPGLWFRPRWPRGRGLEGGHTLPNSNHGPGSPQSRRACKRGRLWNRERLFRLRCRRLILSAPPSAAACTPWICCASWGAIYVRSGPVWRWGRPWLWCWPGWPVCSMKNCWPLGSGAPAWPSFWPSPVCRSPPWRGPCPSGAAQRFWNRRRAASPDSPGGG